MRIAAELVGIVAGMLAIATYLGINIRTILVPSNAPFILPSTAVGK